MSFIKGQFYDVELASIVPVFFRIEGRNLIICYVEGAEAARWPLNNVHMHFGPIDGRPLRLVCGSDVVAYLEPETSLNISWLASQCPQFYRKPGNKSRSLGMAFAIIACISIGYAIYSGYGEVIFSRVIQPAITLVKENAREPIASSNIGDYLADKLANKTSQEKTCDEATKRVSGKLEWNWDALAGTNVRKALDRGFTLSYCAIVLIDRSVTTSPDSLNTPSQFKDPHPETFYKKQTMAQLCRIATRRANGDLVWDRVPEMIGYLREALKRGYTITECAEVLASVDRIAKSAKARPNGFEQKVLRKKTPSSRAMTSDERFLARQPKHRICRMATKQTENGQLLWDPTSSTKDYIEEADRRGYTLAECAQALEDFSIGKF